MRWNHLSFILCCFLPGFFSCASLTSYSDRVQETMIEIDPPICVVFQYVMVDEHMQVLAPPITKITCDTHETVRRLMKPIDEL